MHDTTFSVVLPTYGRPVGLLRCLDGLAGIAFPRDKFEVLVVSDGPGLPDEAILRRVTQGLRIRIVQQDHRGPATARNRGAAMATGRYLAFIDDDCVPDPGWLAALTERLAGDPAVMIGGLTLNALTEDAYPDATQLLVDFMTDYHDGSTTARTRFFATCNLTVPADAFRALGGFDPEFAYAGGEDRDFSDRWHTSGGRSVYEPKAIVHHSHRLTLSQYLGQHFRYGRGALRFHRAKATRDRARQETPFRFYVDLVRYPLSRRGAVRGIVRSALLLVAQGATAAGFWWERIGGKGPSGRAAGPKPSNHEIQR